MAKLKASVHTISFIGLKTRVALATGCLLYNLSTNEMRMLRDDKKTRVTKFVALFLTFITFVILFPTTVLDASEWEISESTEIYWVETADANINDIDLKAQVQLFSREIQAKGLSKSTLPISYGARELAGDHDIVLLLDASLGIAAEGYQIIISNGQPLVKASDADGLFYGCRFVEKALLSGISLDCVNDRVVKPDYPERALFLDCGRKYYSPEWIKDIIREISWSNMNAIYIHFAEEMGFRLESKVYPWLAGGDNTLCVGGADFGTAADNSKYITQDEMREIAEVAKLYHVEIIPSLDSPGHMNYAVKKYNEKYNVDIGNYFHYNENIAIVQGSGPDNAQKNYSRGIDISNAEAVTFAKNLYAEYAGFFKGLGCTKFDIGGDELLGWGDSIDSTISKWNQLDHWKTYAQNRSNNTNAVAYDAFMYYVNDIYELVKGNVFTTCKGIGSNTVIGNNNVKGSAFCVWCDKPSTESDTTVKAGILPCLRMNGAKAWDADLNKTISYSYAQHLLDLIGDVPTNLEDVPEIKQCIA